MVEYLVCFNDGDPGSIVVEAWDAKHAEAQVQWIYPRAKITSSQPICF